jgi:hypothetical protein
MKNPVYNNPPKRNYLRNTQAFHINWATHFTSVAPALQTRYPAILTEQIIKTLQSGSANFRETDKRRTNAETLMENLTQQRLGLLYGDPGTTVTLESIQLLPDLAPNDTVSFPAGWIWQCVNLGDAILALANPPAAEGDIHELQLNPLPPIHHDAIPTVEYTLDAGHPIVKWNKNGYKALAIQYAQLDAEHWQGQLTVTGTPAPLNLPAGAKPITYRLRPIYLLHDQPHGQYGSIAMLTVPGE